VVKHVARLHAEERRQQLLATAREEFLRVGPDGARISDIADRAGVNVALLYRYFDSKEQLFEEAIVEPLDHLLADMLDETVRDANGPDTIEHFYRTLLVIFTDYLELFNVVLFSGREHGQAFFMRRLAPFLDALAERARTVGEPWPQTLDPALTTPMSVGMCWGVAIDAHFRGVELDLDEVTSVLVTITRQGLIGRPRPEPEPDGGHEDA
jgi:AcrR family transcriptional regulator